MKSNGKKNTFFTNKVCWKYYSDENILSIDQRKLQIPICHYLCFVRRKNIQAHLRGRLSPSLDHIFSVLHVVPQGWLL